MRSTKKLEHLAKTNPSILKFSNTLYFFADNFFADNFFADNFFADNFFKTFVGIVTDFKVVGAALGPC